MSKMEKIMAAAMGAISIGASAHAATVTITPEASYYGTSLADLNTLSHPVIGGNTAATGFYEIDFYVKSILSSADTAAGYYGLGNVVFNEATSGGVSRSGDYAGDVGNSTVNNTAGMVNGYWGNTISPANGQTLALQWTTNTDIGPSTHDGIDIAVGIPNGLAATDARTTWGQNGQTFNLQAYENLATNNPGSTYFYIGKQVVQVTASGFFGGAAPNPLTEGFSLYNGTVVAQVADGTTQTFALNSLHLGPTPEPTGLASLAIGGLLAGRRRRA